MPRRKPASRRDAADRGTQTPAQLSRPGGVVTVALPVEVTAGTTRLQRADVQRYDDAHLIDRMHDRAQLNDRQHVNACALLAVWVAKGGDGRLSARIDAAPPGRALGRDPDAEGPADIYRAAIRTVGPMMAAHVEAMLRGQHPGVRWLATLQSALDRLDYLPDRWDGLRWTVEHDA